MLPVVYTTSKRDRSTHMFIDTPGKIIIEPENHLFEKGNHPLNLHFWVPCLCSRVYGKLSLPTPLCLLKQGPSLKKQEPGSSL